MRYSIAGQQAAEAKKAQLANQKFNVEWGSVSLRVQAGTQIEATDNVRLTANGRQPDIAIRPEFGLLGVVRVTERNSLTLKMAIGYTKYLRTTSFDSLYLAPDSDLSFDIYVDDFVINLHDTFSYSQDVLSDPTISGVGSLSRFENRSGLSVTWDLNKAILSAGYDHYIYLPMDSQFSYQTYAAELFNLSGGASVSPIALVGLQLAGGFKNYDENVLNDDQHFSVGPFASVRLSEYTQVRASVGYTAYFIDSNGAASNSVGTLSGVYADASFHHRVNPMVSYSLSVGRQLQSGLFAQTLDVIYARGEAKWNVFRKTSLSTTLSYEHSEQGGVLRETSQRYGFGFSLGRPWTEHFTTTLGYQFYLKDSDISNNNYLQNRLVLDATYAF